MYGLPRTLWLGEDGTLRMRPVPVLEMLRHDKKTWTDISLANGESKKLDGVVGDSCELIITLAPQTTGKCGLRVRASPGGEEQNLPYYDAQAKELVFDATQSDIDGRRVVERAPFELKAGEPLELRVFIDRSVVEIYANDRLAFLLSLGVYSIRIRSFKKSNTSADWRAEDRVGPAREKPCYIVPFWLFFISFYTNLSIICEHRPTLANRLKCYQKKKIKKQKIYGPVLFR